MYDSARQHEAEFNIAEDLVEQIPVRLSKDELVELSKLNPAISTLHILGEWLLIVGAVLVCQRHWNLLLYLVVTAFIASRQHALLILVHDGVHYRLYQNRRLNDWVGELLLAWPHLVAMRSYRLNHFAHHRYLNTERDPDWLRRQGDEYWAFPKSASALTRLFLRDVVGLGFLPLLRLAGSFSSKDSGASRAFVAARSGFYLAALVLIVWFGAVKLVLLYWVIPFSTWLVFILHVRSIAEHSAIDDQEHPSAQTRTTIPGLVERIFLAPKNINYHIEHHFFPSVPFYRLTDLHRLLERRSAFRDSAHITRTYLGVLRECTGAGEVRAAGGGVSASL